MTHIVFLRFVIQPVNMGHSATHGDTHYFASAVVLPYCLFIFQMIKGKDKVFFPEIRLTFLVTSHHKLISLSTPTTTTTIIDNVGIQPKN